MGQQTTRDNEGGTQERKWQKTTNQITAQIVSTSDMGAERTEMKALQPARIRVKKRPLAQRVGAVVCTHCCLEKYNR